MPTFDSDKPLTVHGVQGRLTHRTTKPGATSWFRQRWMSAARPINSYGSDATLRVEMRFDDELGNGHHTFAITGEVVSPDKRSRNRVIACGCLHDEIARVFPELSCLIPWHLTDSDGPLHYFSNTVYLAGDRDHYGLRAGERRDIRTRDGSLMWELVAVNDLGVAISTTPTGLKHQGADAIPLFILQNTWVGDNPPATPKLEWRRSYRVGEGKARELDAARRAANWPDATDAILMSDKETLTAALKARHPELLQRFRSAVEAAGFLWSPPA